METELILKKLLGLIPYEEEKPEKFETKDIPDNVDVSDFTPDEIVMGDQLVDDVQMSKQQGQEEKKDGEDKRSEETLVHTQTILPSVNDSENNKEEEKIEEMIEDIPKEKKEEEEKETKKFETKVTPLSFTSKKKIDDDEDDDELSIQGPINMDMLSYIELMEFVTAMQSREKKKRMKEHHKEAKIVKHAIEILSSLLSEIDIDNFATPIDKLGQLVNDASE
ncbi:uncharacterized protein LOC131028096 [Cryptomeria japonica]|uniref:uncharacterized protein LOC131028096 n=1 Tax=Cryptomeria japonica TaxID=3369 RepID=UPI0027DA18EE|nr:uncharacterized protein LOC131028096 [Cryptomeria japonica]